MAKIFSLLLLLFSLSLLISLSSSHPSSPNTPSQAHDALQSYGFPVGLLPTNTLSHSVNTSTGDFFVSLDFTCKILLPPDNYLATYSNTIKGKIVENRIRDLDGIRVRAFFKWWSITGIRRSGDDLVFEVGGVTVKYPAMNFDESPACEGEKKSDS